MGRRKKVDFTETSFAKRVQGLLVRHRVDPLEELLTIYKETLPWPDDPSLLIPLYDKGWEPYELEDGTKRLRMGQGRRVEVMKSIAPFVYPTLRASESTNINDNRIQITIRHDWDEKKPEVLPEARRVLEIEDGD